MDYNNAWLYSKNIEHRPAFTPTTILAIVALKTVVISGAVLLHATLGIMVLIASLVLNTVFLLALIQRWHAAKELRTILDAQSEQFQSMMKKITFGVVIHGSQSEVLHINDTAIKLLEIERKDVLGKASFTSTWKIYGADGSEVPIMLQPVAQAILTKQPVHGMVLGIDRPRNQDRVWLKVDAVPELTADGRVDYVICTFADITHQKQAEASVREDHALLNSIFETTIAAIVVLNAEGHIIFANQHAEAMLGVTCISEEPRLFTAETWKHIDGAGQAVPREEHPFMQVLQSKQPIHAVQHYVENDAGERRMLEINGAPIKDEQGNVQRLVFLVEDVTVRYQLQRDLREQEHLHISLKKEREMGKTSHELFAHGLARVPHTARGD